LELSFLQSKDGDENYLYFKETYSVQSLFNLQTK
jgi:hypothetical protein